MNNKALPWALALLALLLLAVLAGVTWGSAQLGMAQVWSIIQHQLMHSLGMVSTLPDGAVQQYQIVWMIRLPRVLMAALVGAGLAVVGVVMQAMVRNPLADPYMLGVSAGASTGAVAVLAWGVLSTAGLYAVSFGAFAGALAATVLVYLLAQRRGQIPSARLILSGVAVGYMLTGLTSLITLTAGQRDLANALLTWVMGSLAGTQWRSLGLPAAVLLLGMLWLLAQARPLNALLAGDETAATLGVSTERLRRQLFIVVSLLTGTMVAVSGAIGFVGLMIPHTTRMLVGTDHRRVLPIAALMGAVFLVVVDGVARTWFAPMEIPVGVITAFVGGPFFIAMLWRGTGREDA